MSLNDESGSGDNVVPVDFGGGAKKGTTVAKNATIADRVLKQIQKEPRTVEQLALVCDATEKQIRNAVTALRRKYPSTHGDHIVSFKRSYWTAAELERRGHVLHPTKGGTLKVEKSTKTGGPKKPRTKKQEKADERSKIAAHVIEELGDSPDARKVAKLVIARYDVLIEAEGELPRQRQKARDLIKASDAAFAEAMEEGLETGDEAAAVQKLHNCEQAWQHKLEKKAEAIELRKEANETFKRARDSFAGLMENVRQLDLDFESVA